MHNTINFQQCANYPPQASEQWSISCKSRTLYVFWHRTLYSFCFVFTTQICCKFSQVIEINRSPDDTYHIEPIWTHFSETAQTFFCQKYALVSCLNVSNMNADFCLQYLIPWLSLLNFPICAICITAATFHDDVIKWIPFPRCWPFVREIHRSPMNYPHKGQWHGALMFSEGLLSCE